MNPALIYLIMISVRPRKCIRIIIQFGIFYLLVLPIQAQEIIYPPDTPLCTFDLNNNGDTAEDSEIAICDTGQVYNPITDLPGPTTALSCPLGKEPCVRPELNICQIDGTPCSDDTTTECVRPQACGAVVWDEDGGPGILTYNAPTADTWYCPSNGVTYSTEAAGIAGCRLMGDITDPVEFVDGFAPNWLCFRTGTKYFTQVEAEAACTYTGDIGPAPLNLVPGDAESWYCAENDTSYANEIDAIAGCRIINTISGFDCPTTPWNDLYLTNEACEAACEQTGACALEIQNFECPLGAYDCINETPDTEDYYCSVSACATYADGGVYDPVVDSFTPNDGQIDDDGCVDNIQIFNGKAESCRLAGAASAWQNCCNEADEDLLTDSQGSVAESVAWATGLNALYDAGTAAYTAYTAATAGGATTGAAAGSSASAFQTSLIESLGSTTMIVGVAVIAVTAYLENACPPEGVVTAIKKKSKQCVLIGEKCTTRFLGSCVQKAEVHCCFNSLMATLVQVGGRQQLGMNFGTVDSPNCRGFTPEEFQSIDFSKIDLTEYYAEIETRAQSEIENEITTVITNTANDI